MFFSKLARIVAWIAFVFGLAILGLAIYGGFEPDSARFAAQYLGTENTGEAVERAIRIILFALVLGVVGEVGVALSNLTIEYPDE